MMKPKKLVVGSLVTIPVLGIGFFSMVPTYVSAETNEPIQVEGVLPTNFNQIEDGKMHVFDENFLTMSKAEKVEKLNQRIESGDISKEVGNKLLEYMGSDKAENIVQRKTNRNIKKHGLLAMLGVSEEEEKEYLEKGTSLNQVAKEKGVSSFELRSLMLQAMNQKIEEVKEKQGISEEQIEQILSKAEERIAKITIK